ncbi:hypothetical protein GQ55_9G011600 [Panicum hallii var. hallii]|uniref:Uncharacterized protein n=1 Tax=Panicum hallii var. hallii TaxID=1504633 RepID=A0A2T7BYB5_9POAL|nr:hypothetical protein GQ55_9G011600 [Panicum hallii var. hallii]
MDRCPVVDVLAAPTSTQQPIHPLLSFRCCKVFLRRAAESLAPHSRNPRPSPSAPSSRNWKRLVAAPGPAPAAAAAAPTPRSPCTIPPSLPPVPAVAADEQVRCGVK